MFGLKRPVVSQSQDIFQTGHLQEVRNEGSVVPDVQDEEGSDRPEIGKSLCDVWGDLLRNDLRVLERSTVCEEVLYVLVLLSHDSIGNTPYLLENSFGEVLDVGR